MRNQIEVDCFTFHFFSFYLYIIDKILILDVYIYLSKTQWNGNVGMLEHIQFLYAGKKLYIYKKYY